MTAPKRSGFWRVARIALVLIGVPVLAIALLIGFNLLRPIAPPAYLAELNQIPANAAARVDPNAGNLPAGAEPAVADGATTRGAATLPAAEPASETATELPLFEPEPDASPERQAKLDEYNKAFDEVRQGLRKAAESQEAFNTLPEDQQRLLDRAEFVNLKAIEESMGRPLTDADRQSFRRLFYPRLAYGDFLERLKTAGFDLSSQKRFNDEFLRILAESQDWNVAVVLATTHPQLNTFADGLYYARQCPGMHRISWVTLNTTVHLFQNMGVDFKE